MNTYLKNLFILLLSSSLFSACVSQKNPRYAEVENPNISAMLDTSAILKNSFSGLLLYDLETKKPLYSRYADRHFIPASNTKLYTLFACLNVLGDSIPALKYVIRNDSMIFWGTGDPTFLHSEFTASKTLDFLRENSDKKLYFSDANFTNKVLGSGWMWDDYNGQYQPELSPFPMYGNIVRFRVKDSDVSIEPPIFESTFFQGAASQREVVRLVNDNRFLVNQEILESADYEQDIPFKTSANLTKQLLIDTLKQNINLSRIAIDPNAKTLYSLPVDTVYRRMMQVSDNMLAEHLLLLCGSTLTDTVNTQKTIDLITEKYLQDLPDAPNWVDGSGLSRYNLFTPRTNVKLLEKLHDMIPEERLFSFMAIGGKAGTLQGMYKDREPFIFAKSGTVSGVYNQTGYLKTKSGKTFLFSFMNNNFNSYASPVRKEVERVLTWVHENY